MSERFVYFSPEDILLSLSQLWFQFRQARHYFAHVPLRDKCEISSRVLFRACFFVVTQSRGLPRAFFAGKTRSCITIFSCVFTPTERSTLDNDKFSFRASRLSSFASSCRSLTYSPFPYEVARDFRSFTLSGHHPLFARYVHRSRIVVSSQLTSATSSQDTRLPRSIHLLINKDECLPFV